MQNSHGIFPYSAHFRLTLTFISLSVGPEHASAFFHSFGTFSFRDDRQNDNQISPNVNVNALAVTDQNHAC